MFVEGSARGQMKDRNLLSVQTGIPRLNVFLPFSRPEPLGESQICLLCLSLCSYIQSMRSALRIISKHCHQFTWMHWNKFYVYSIQYLWYVYIYINIVNIIILYIFIELPVDRDAGVYLLDQAMLQNLSLYKNTTSCASRLRTLQRQDHVQQELVQTIILKLQQPSRIK